MESTLWKNHQSKLDKIANPGQNVRISRLKGNFEKGYLPNWSEEHFTVKDYKSKDRGVYKLVDYDQEPIEGDFYKRKFNQSIMLSTLSKK